MKNGTQLSSHNQVSDTFSPIWGRLHRGKPLVSLVTLAILVRAQDTEDLQFSIDLLLIVLS